MIKNDNMRSIIKYLFVLAFIITSGYSKAQLTIQNVSFNGEDVSNSGISNIIVFNSGNEFTSSIEAVIYNSDRFELMKAVTQPIQFKNGLNSISRQKLSLNNINYANNDVAKYIHDFHRLPSGNYIYCVRVLSSIDVEATGGAEFCDEVSMERDFSMNLVSPFDGDEIETSYPLLVWSHTEPFIRNNTSDDYYIQLTELLDGQNPETALSLNRVLFTKNNISSHSILYPVSAAKLEEGKSYCWKVVKSVNGKIVNQSEVWKFKISGTNQPKDHKYGMMSKQLNASFYTCKNGKVFFRFDEAYTSKGKLNLKLKDAGNKDVIASVKSDNREETELNYKATGSNAYLLDVDELHLKAGFYILEVLNEKKDKYLLKIKIE